MDILRCICWIAHAISIFKKSCIDTLATLMSGITIVLHAGRQNGKFVQHSCAHRLLLQHWSLSELSWDHKSGDEEKPAGKKKKKREMRKCSIPKSVLVE